MVTEGDKVMLPANAGLIGASRMAPSPTQHQHLLLHSIQEDGSSQVRALGCGCSAPESSSCTTLRCTTVMVTAVTGIADTVKQQVT